MRYGFSPSLTVCGGGNLVIGRCSVTLISCSVFRAFYKSLSDIFLIEGRALKFAISFLRQPKL